MAQVASEEKSSVTSFQMSVKSSRQEPVAREEQPPQPEADLFAYGVMGLLVSLWLMAQVASFQTPEKKQSLAAIRLQFKGN